MSVRGLRRSWSSRIVDRSLICSVRIEKAGWRSAGLRARSQGISHAKTKRIVNIHNQKYASHNHSLCRCEGVVVGVTYLSEVEGIDVLDVEGFVLEVEEAGLATLGQVVVELGQLSSH